MEEMGPNILMIGTPGEHSKCVGVEHEKDAPTAAKKLRDASKTKHLKESGLSTGEKKNPGLAPTRNSPGVNQVSEHETELSPKIRSIERDQAHLSHRSQPDLTKLETAIA
jgi:hypothetical protein